MGSSVRRLHGRPRLFLCIATHFPDRAQAECPPDEISGTQRPHVELIIHCHRLMYRVIAKRLTPVPNAALFTASWEQFPHPSEQIGGCSGQTVRRLCPYPWKLDDSLCLGALHVSPIPEDILGIDVLKT